VELRLRLATRASKLALAQSKWVAAQITERHPGVRVELVTVTTRGDAVQDRALSKVGGKGLFTKEIEDALLCGGADLAVHSLKDLPTALPEGLTLGAICGAEDARDVLVSRNDQRFEALPSGAAVGTSSLRRQAQLRHARPDLTFVDIRGNVDTRLRKLAEGEVDALILAGTGLARLGLADRISQWLPTKLCLPAVGQGLLGVEIRSDDVETAALLRPLHDEAAATRAEAERSALACLGGGCHTPVGVHATVSGDAVSVEGVVAGPSGEPYYRAAEAAPRHEAAAAGERLAQRLKAMGAGTLLG
jgi:hydroxymethylbilane synthase